MAANPGCSTNVKSSQWQSSLRGSSTLYRRNDIELSAAVSQETPKHSPGVPTIRTCMNRDERANRMTSEPITLVEDGKAAAPTIVVDGSDAIIDAVAQNVGRVIARMSGAACTLCG
jgi:hypothetical protein